MDIKNVKAFTLMELIVSLAIMGTLAAIVAPVYTKYTAESKNAKTMANMTNVKQAFLNYYLLYNMKGERPEFPPAPSDSILDDAWANSPILKNGQAPVSLFSEGVFPKNGFGLPFKYALIDTSDRRKGFILIDPTTGFREEYRP
jgi:prepilin-type N-terminal cleavage/methylation domain-containing protein